MEPLGEVYKVYKTSLYYFSQLHVNLQLSQFKKARLPHFSPALPPLLRNSPPHPCPSIPCSLALSPLSLLYLSKAHDLPQSTCLTPHLKKASGRPSTHPRPPLCIRVRALLPLESLLGFVPLNIFSTINIPTTTTNK